MQFLSIVGQDSTKEKLISLVSQNRLSHALLFLGKEGSGSLELAIALAQYVVCEKNKPGSPNQESSLFGDAPLLPSEYLNDSCGTCSSCKKAAEHIHPDIHYSFPTISTVEKAKSSDFIVEWRNFLNQTPFGNAYDWIQSLSSENKQGNITTYECEDILRKLNLKSFESGYKILIQWMPEYLGNEGNKLLKMIEEPPPNTLFIFVAEDESRIISTILSRTQLIKINRLDNDEVEKWLVEKHNVPVTKARNIASLSQGSLREAFQILNQGDEDWNEMLREWLNAILKNGPSAQVKWIEEISKQGREKHKQFIGYFIHLLGTALHENTMGTSEGANETEVDFAQRLNKIAAPEQLEAIVKELDRATYYIERNANPKMLFMALSIKIYHIIKDKSVILIN
jgi:DNA polymerase-3 subunit delta'